MSNFIKLGFSALLFLTSELTILSSQEEKRDQSHLGPPVIIFISPAEPTTKDRITSTIKALDYSSREIERVSIAVNGKEVKVCLYPPCVYRGGPYPEGSLSYEVKVYGYTDVGPRTGPRRVYARKATRFEPRPIRAVGLSKGRINLIPLAENENTQWSNGTLVLPFPGEETDKRGFACYWDNSVLEDDKVYSKVLLTHPELRFIKIFDSITNQYFYIPHIFLFYGGFSNVLVFRL